MTRRPLIVFDVNETLLDLQTVEPTFERIFGEKGAMRLWFANSSSIPPPSRSPAAMFPSPTSPRRR
jgi:hypothetical protein